MSALIVVDLQNDFLPPSRSLAVSNGTDIIPGIIDLCSKRWDLIVATRDYHPPNHCLFASNWGLENYSQKEFKSPVDDSTQTQILWPNHCVQGSPGLELDEQFKKAFESLKTPHMEVKKGYLVDREYYSAFEDIWGAHKTELHSVLQEHGIKKIHVCGLAYDFCVLNTALSGARLGYETVVLKYLSKSVYPDKEKETDEAYEKGGVTVSSQPQPLHSI